MDTHQRFYESLFYFLENVLDHCLDRSVQALSILQRYLILPRWSQCLGCRRYFMIQPISHSSHYCSINCQLNQLPAIKENEIADDEICQALLEWDLLTD